MQVDTVSSSELSIDDMRTAGWLQGMISPYAVFHLPSAVHWVLFKSSHYPHFE